MTEVLTQNNYVKLIAFFLSEIVRSRRTSIRRAAEISQSVINNMDVFTSEELVLTWVTRLEKDFEEIGDYKKALHFNFDSSSISVYEDEVKQFAAWLFENDMARSAQFLKDASDRQVNIQQLCIKHPDFCDYLLQHTDKGVILQNLQPA